MIMNITNGIHVHSSHQLWLVNTVTEEHKCVLLGKGLKTLMGPGVLVTNPLSLTVAYMYHSDLVHLWGFSEIPPPPFFAGQAPSIYVV